MAITYFGYWEVGQAIKSIIEGLTFRDSPNPAVIHEDRPLHSSRFVHIALADRDDQLVEDQDIAAGQRKSVRASYNITICQSSTDGTEAGRLRNRMLEEIEVVLLANRTLNGTVKSSVIGPVTLLESRDDDNFWSLCVLRLDCQKTITTQ